MIDGSAEVKHRLSYEAELIYICTACHLNPDVQLHRFIYMHAYAIVYADNLYHAVLRVLTVMNDKLAEYQDIYTLPVAKYQQKPWRMTCEIMNFTRKQSELLLMGPV